MAGGVRIGAFMGVLLWIEKDQRIKRFYKYRECIVIY
jgi:hypothetical protein